MIWTLANWNVLTVDILDSICCVQKHCKNHIVESNGKHVTGHYHPYTNTTTASDNTHMDAMDVEGELFDLNCY